MDIPSWISAISAVIALVGGGYSYWQAKLSKQAKADAQTDRKRAENAERRADEAARHAETQLLAIQEQVAAIKKGLPAIAQAVEKTGTNLQEKLNTGHVDLRARIEWVTGSQYAIINPDTTQLRIEYVRNRDAFFRLDLDDTFEVPPSGQLKFLALEAWEHPIPDNLILDEIGTDKPLYLPIPPKKK